MTSKIPCTNPAHRVKTHLAGTTAAMECQAGERAYSGKSQGKISATPPSGGGPAISEVPGGKVLRQESWGAVARDDERGDIHLVTEASLREADYGGTDLYENGYRVHVNSDGELWLNSQEDPGQKDSPVLLSDIQDGARHSSQEIYPEDDDGGEWHLYTAAREARDNPEARQFLLDNATASDPVNPYRKPSSDVASKNAATSEAPERDEDVFQEGELLYSSDLQ